MKPIQIFLDNKSAIDLAKIPHFHNCFKHIKIQYHYVRSSVQDGEVEAIRISTNEQQADILTKLSKKERNLISFMI